MKMAILRRSMALHSRCDMEVGPCDYFWSLWNIEELWWSCATPAQAFICATMGCVGGLIIGLVTEYLGCKSPARIIPWLCKVVSCFGCLIWVVSIGQVLHLSHFHAYPWVGVCLQVRNCSQHYPGSHGSTRDQLLAGMCCKISCLDKIIVVDVLNIVLNHETEWNGRSVTREVFVKVHSTLFSQMWVTQDTWWQN